MKGSLPDIGGRTDLVELLTAFYTDAYADDLLGPVFVGVAKMDLQVHLPVICDFWETVLFRTGSYQRNALIPHRNLNQLTPLTPAHFARWLALWIANVDRHYAGAHADFAKLQATRIADAMSRRLNGSPPARADLAEAGPNEAGYGQHAIAQDARA